jgi:hypothetical protein
MGGWNKKVVNLSGQNIGKWAVLYRSNEPTANGSQAWICRCECGIEKPVSQPYLLSGMSTMCSACAHKPRPYPPNKVPLLKWRWFKKNADRRRITISISNEEAYSLLVQQGFKCALSGLRIQLPFDSHDICTASLDRIDVTKGYELGNTQWVHRDINLMKNTLPEPYFINMCRQVATHNPEIVKLTPEELSIQLPQLRYKGRAKDWDGKIEQRREAGRKAARARWG